MKLTDLKEGDRITIDGGFTCAPAGETVVHVDKGGPWFHCTGEHDYQPGAALNEKHYLEGQEDTDGELIGVSMVTE